MSTTAHAHADKRSVSTDALETLGTIIGPGEARDAIHLAVEPVIAGERLRPGDDVGLINGAAYHVAVTGCALVGDQIRRLKPLGIVDPFLKAPVKAGERFWLVVYPRQIRSLRHVWEHPDFPTTPAAPMPELSRKAAPSALGTAPKLVSPAEMSAAWIHGFADSIPLEYETIMSGAREYVENGDYLCFGGLLEGMSVPDEFWDHYETVTGETIPERRRGSFFTCSC